MKGIRETKASPKADLLVCFPCHAHHLTLMAKPICSPGRHPDLNNKCHHLKKSSTTRSSGHASPLLWGKTESMGSEIAEPTSPKVTCAGKIKVRSKKTTNTCRSWQSVMEDIEKIHNNDNETTHWKRKKKSTPNWTHCISFKKEVMHLLACFRGMRIDMGCFGAFNGASIVTVEEEEEDEEYEEEYRENQVGIEDCENQASGSVFSEWVIVLQEKQSNIVQKENTEEKEIEGARNDGSSEEEVEEQSNVPPPNALLLMRCSSAPVRSLLKEKNEEQGKEENENREEGNKVKEKAKGKSLKSLIEENRKIENLLVMQYNSDFYKISSSRIAKNKDKGS